MDRNYAFLKTLLAERAKARGEKKRPFETRIADIEMQIAKLEGTFAPEKIEVAEERGWEDLTADELESIRRTGKLPDGRRVEELHHMAGKRSWRPLSPADQYSIAKAAWSATQVIHRETHDAKFYCSLLSWEHLEESERGYDVSLADVVVKIHRNTVREEPMGDLGLPEGILGTSLILFVRIATILVERWMATEEAGFYSR